MGYVLMDRTFLGIVYSYMLLYLLRSMYDRLWQSRVSIFCKISLFEYFYFIRRRLLLYEFFLSFFSFDSLERLEEEEKILLFYIFVND